MKLDLDLNHCGHGIKRELPIYRFVRIWEMNCGEVRCLLSKHDYFTPANIKEFIDAALDGKARSDEWLRLDRHELARAQGHEAHARRST